MKHNLQLDIIVWYTEVQMLLWSVSTDDNRDLILSSSFPIYQATPTTPIMANAPGRMAITIWIENKTIKMWSGLYLFSNHFMRKTISYDLSQSEISTYRSINIINILSFISGRYAWVNFLCMT